MFKIDYRSRDNLPELTIKLIGSFSIDGDLQYHADLRQLKYYIPPTDPNNLSYDLDYNAEYTNYKPGTYIKLDDILRWISDNFTQLSKPSRPLSTNEGHWLDVDFVCRRGALRTIFCSPYNKFKGWIICASKYRGTIYLCQFYIDENQHANESQDKLYSRGFKFEQYMVADHPSHKPDLSVPLNECEEFRCVFKTKFGNHSLLYGAEIDGICSKQPIKDTLVGKTDKFHLIELKTLPLYGKNTNLNGKLPANRVIGWWSQNYLAGIDKTICGFKNKSIVKMIREYPTQILPQLSKVKCDVNDCKMFCKIFLDYVKNIVVKDHSECMYKFHWDPSTNNIVHYSEERPNHELYFFLKPWFIDAMENTESSSLSV
ncbi:PREDICTED: decapping and exoribonuclease protein-like [Dinoponera quadriceps]|uniref:Decapping nuclease n=1 Tax=Dinoponera quadriceps TaxID=609295 RepID=A0A6P3WPW1_DINQU|nr:PREDICTED: decapping and exoribonuclease protein-like [Dinoponera quadriceps]